MADPILHDVQQPIHRLFHGMTKKLLIQLLSGTLLMIIYPLSREILSKSSILRAVCNSIRDLYMMFVHTRCRGREQQGLHSIVGFKRVLKGGRGGASGLVQIKGSTDSSRVFPALTLLFFPLFLSSFLSLSLFTTFLHNGFFTRNGKLQQEPTALGSVQQTACHCFKRPNYQQVRFQNVVWWSGCCIEWFEENDVVHLDRLARYNFMVLFTLSCITYTRDNRQGYPYGRS